MFRWLTSLLTACLLWPALGLAEAPTLPADYLLGAWSLDGKDRCKSADARLIQFDRDGTFKSVKAGRIDVLGFYMLVDNSIELHMLVAPDSGYANVTGFVGHFSYSYINAFIVRQEPDRLTVTTGPTGEEKSTLLDRCP